MKFTNIVAVISSVAALLSGTVSVVLPGADTPLFYLVASSPSASANLLPLRIEGGTNGYSTLTGSSPIGQFYFYQGRLRAHDPDGSTVLQYYMPFLSSQLTSTGCTTYGGIKFIPGPSTNKCGRYEYFQIQSNTENSQLGAKLVFNYVGGFYACGSGQDVWYKVDAADGPTECSPIELYTVPVTV
ncbi:unnamed protein product [Cyclocybe aegerita]|uniref:Uncharacterized protein n=1 Tax=Cyclocybe aegerita TaxID=1973307 RepID=A0A8S0X4A1_CYCAE|nr:unnamed protein product [Cyclocybe aegerita]